MVLRKIPSKVYISELDFQIFEFFSQILSLKLGFEWCPYLFGPLWDRIRRQKWQGSTERVFGGLTIRHCFDNAWSESSGDKKESASIGALSMSSGVSLRARIKVIWEIKSKKDWTNKQTDKQTIKEKGSPPENPPSKSKGKFIYWIYKNLVK